MHPNPRYHCANREVCDRLIEEVCFGMIFRTTPDGPRVVHTPILSTGDGAIQFHVARTNALAGYLDGQTALAVINGPDAYVSPRWYDERDTVPTWDYVAVELEGPVRRLTDKELDAFLQRLIATREEGLAGPGWTAGEASEKTWSSLFGGIAGFEMDVRERRATVKLSQRKPRAVRQRIAEGHVTNGHVAMADQMRKLTS